MAEQQQRLTKRRSPNERESASVYKPLVLPINFKQRVQNICAIMAGAFGITFICSLLFSKTTLSQIVFGSLSLFMVIYSIIVLILIKVKPLSDRQYVILGLAYIIIGAAAMSVGEVVIEHNDDRSRSGITGICIWIIMFPVFIPSRPLHTAITAITAASLLPLAYYIGQLFELKEVSGPTLFDWFLPGYFCAGLAAVTSKQISNWSRALALAKQEAEELGSYKLVSPLSHGGMGEIWKAEHKLLSQEVAIKFIKIKENDGDQDFMQFYSEADAIAKLSSPHTISILDYGVSQSGNLYYAMEYINGLDLDDLITKHGAQAPERVIHILLQAAQSLAEAHEQGLIHRDIKPANIMISTMGMTPDFVKVLDFGLVQQVEKDNHTPVAGTPGFMAPEVISESELPSPSSDIYALGCVAYWLLTGKEVFSADSERDLLKMHLRKKPKPIQELGVICPPELESLVLQCLNKQKSERIPDGKSFYKIVYDLSLKYPWKQTEAIEWWSHQKTDKSS